MVVLLEGPPLSTEERWSSLRVTIRFLVTSLTMALLPRSISLAGWPALEKIPWWFQTFPFTDELFIGIFNATEIFLYPSPDLCLDTILPHRSTDNSLDFTVWFVL